MRIYEIIHLMGMVSSVFLLFISLLFLFLQNKRSNKELELKEVIEEKEEIKKPEIKKKFKVVWNDEFKIVEKEKERNYDKL